MPGCWELLDPSTAVDYTNARWGKGRSQPRVCSWKDGHHGQLGLIPSGDLQKTADHALGLRLGIYVTTPNTTG
jgi:hypothetical protein